MAGTLKKGACFFDFLKQQVYTTKMIDIIYPHGGYGSYLAQSIYHYSDLRIEQYRPLAISSNGSGHEYRTNANNKKFIRAQHQIDLMERSEYLILIKPDHDHNLDYFNNHYSKQAKYSLTPYLDQLKINQKLTQWDYNKNYDQQTPNWIVREFLSLNIEELFKNTFDPALYIIPGTISIVPEDIINNFLPTLKIIFCQFDLKFTVAESEIEKNHNHYLSLQKYYNSQINCNDWIDSILHNKDKSSPCQTIIDEAYIQHKLRKNGYELQCNNLNVFPTTVDTLRNLLYNSESHNETMHNTN